MRGIGNQQQQEEEEEEGVALVQVVDDGCNNKTKKQPQPQPPDNDDDESAIANNKTAAEHVGWSTWTSGGLSSAVKMRMPGRVGLAVGGLILLALLLAFATTCTTTVDFAAISSFLPFGGGGQQQSGRPQRSSSRVLPIPLLCANDTATKCPRAGASAAPAPAPSDQQQQQQAVVECPSYFRYIERDLSPWASSGITREAVERGRRQAHFRLVVVDGRAYVETYKHAFQTRDVFTQWGIVQLLKRYPGRVPDLDLMFNCEDMPEVRAASYPDRSAAPPLFRYCKDPSTLDVLFPDWSFWGWPEVNVRPWAPLLAEMAHENARLPWADREPYAYWKGNPYVSQVRRDLLRCNDSHAAVVYIQDWGFANRNGFRDSNLAQQCRHRYKIYVQGRSWSVSRKYILACDSPVLALATQYQDFFSRGLLPAQHYWPIDPDPNHMCRDIRFAVLWGNAHPAQAQKMGRAGSGFTRDDMAMDLVYDYMLHVLTRYASLLRYKPSVPERAVELCPESMACPQRGRNRDFMMQSREEFVADYDPCIMPTPPLTDDDATNMAHREADVLAKIHTMKST
uniref:Glycosyl transferase CAP10 domain-containing protein n=1 Tax=Leersia perrieri TaxID=77586 RepID=A0A0D9X3D7_9ORYZ